MYNMSMQELDELDQRLLSALRADGREPVATLARRLGVTRATVNSRLDRLVQSGTVLGFTVRVREENDPRAVRAISLIEVEGRTTNDVIKKLRGFPEIHSLHTTNGGWDLVAEIRTISLGNFDAVLGQIRAVDGVVNSETSLLLSSVLR
jgi:DNA-binding Lrp family transcriptional regulator